MIWTMTNFVDFGLDLCCKILHKFRIRFGSEDQILD